MVRISAVVTFILAIGCASVSAQSDMEQLEPEEYFDFWIGDWDLTWEAPDGTTEHGTNKIEWILGGTVLLENFEALDGRFKGYRGKSFSVYHRSSRQWKQTWVDSNAGYLDFQFNAFGNKRIFYRNATGNDGKPIIQRMVFYDIKENSFTWDWELSRDKGKSWQLQWRIFYKRKK